MLNFASKWIAIAVLSFGVVACANDGVGDPCIPESIPCEGSECGFGSQESYIESSSVQCRTRVCIVHKLDRGDGKVADPRENCTNSDSPNCVTDSQLSQSVYCTCRCRDGNKKKVEGCECSDGYKCEEILSRGGDGVRGSYCVKPAPTL